VDLLREAQEQLRFGRKRTYPGRTAIQFSLQTNIHFMSVIQVWGGTPFLACFPSLEVRYLVRCLSPSVFVWRLTLLEKMSSFSVFSSNEINLTILTKFCCTWISVMLGKMNWFYFAFISNLGMHSVPVTNFEDILLVLDSDTGTGSPCFIWKKLIIVFRCCQRNILKLSK
jgi:hypothetical protein